MSEESLPRLSPVTRRELRRFDLAPGLGIALRVLREHLGPLQVARVLMRYARLSLHDPLANLPHDGWDGTREALVRHQLRSAVWIDDALKSVFEGDEDARLVVVREVIAESGGAFIDRMLPLPDREAWERAPLDQRQRFVREATGRFFNADITEVFADRKALGFDVGRCRFVELCDALDRPYLTPMFCAADSVFFGKASSIVDLERTGTLALGGPRCDFRFRFRTDP